MYYVYLLKSEKNSKWYTGTTNDLRKRFNQHNDDRSTYTRNKGPWELVYYEACLDKQDAYVREKYLGTGMGRRYLKNRLKHFLSLTQ